MAAIPSTPILPDDPPQLRQRNVAETIATLRIEGLEPTPDLEYWLSEYGEGRLTSDQIEDAMLRKHHLK